MRFRVVLIAILLATFPMATLARATVIDSATIVPGSIVQGTVKASLAHSYYANPNTNLGAWPLNTGGNNAISFENPQYQQNDLVAFANGGTVTMQFNTPITPVHGEKDLGIFTAQAITGGAGTLFNGNMEAAILVSANSQTWYNLSGQLIGSTATAQAYTGQVYSLNAPTMAYDYGTGATAWNAGAATLSAGQLAALPVANYTTPMPDDTLFNNPSSTNAQRLALTSDNSTADYAEEFGTSAGGNWFDLSGSGLTSIDYVMLNGDANDGNGTGGVRLTNIFANSNAVAVPEPGTISLLGLSGLALLTRLRTIGRRKNATPIGASFSAESLRRRTSEGTNSSFCHAGRTGLRRMKMLRTFLIFVVFLGGSGAAALGSPINSIPFPDGNVLNVVGTVGSGPNTAYLDIDFSNNTPAGPAYAWQYNWSGTATETSMLNAVAAADSNLTVVWDSTYAGFVDNFNYGSNVGSANAFAADNYSYWANYVGSYNSTDATNSATQNINWVYAPNGTDSTNLGDQYDTNGNVLASGVENLFYGWTINGEYQTTNLTPVLPEVAVPEPGTAALLAIGGGIGLLMRRRRAKRRINKRATWARRS